MNREDSASTPRRRMPCASSREQRLIHAVRIAALVSVAALAGCAAHYSPDSTHDPYGFFSGIWHGIVFPYALLSNLLSWLLSLAGISLLSGIEIIGRPNTGLFFYYVGFLVGLGSYGSGVAAR